jgi:hypothetical protein
MADPTQPPSNESQEPFKIPEPKIDPALAPSIAESFSLVEATREAEGFASGKTSDLKQRTWDWRLGFVLKVLLFMFVLAVNGWWIWEVLRMLWRSGSVGSNFHLDDSVLIALVSTSIANFLALVIVVAKHLFPSGPPKIR